MQSKSFKGKVALVTYSSPPEKALELVREIESAGGKVNLRGLSSVG